MIVYLVIIIVILVFIVIFLFFQKNKIQNEKNIVQAKTEELYSENTSLKNKIEELSKQRDESLIELSKYKEKSAIQEKDIIELKAKADKLTNEIMSLSSQNAEYLERIKNMEEIIQNKKQEIQETQEQLKMFFENISSKLLEQNTKKLAEQNQQVLGNTISPIKEYLSQLKEIENKIQRYYDNENKERSSLKTIIEELNKRNDEVKQTADKLVNALTTQVKHQGNWGEFILEKLLELSGLKRDIHYVVQQKDNDKQPDVKILLPNNRCIIIDSKVTLNALINYQSAQTEQERQSYANDIITSIETHYKNLSKKGYEQLENSIDFVLMFIPIESVMNIIYQYKPEVFSNAVHEKVLLVTPASLLASLKAIYYIWQQDNRKKEFENILKAIQDLYDKLGVFINHFEAVKKAINNAQEKFDAAEKSLRTGKGNAMSIIEKKIQPYITPKERITKFLSENEE